MSLKGKNDDPVRLPSLSQWAQNRFNNKMFNQYTFFSEQTERPLPLNESRILDKDELLIQEWFGALELVTPEDPVIEKMNKTTLNRVETNKKSANTNYRRLLLPNLPYLSLPLRYHKKKNVELKQTTPNKKQYINRLALKFKRLKRTLLLKKRRLLIRRKTQKLKAKKTQYNQQFFFKIRPMVLSSKTPPKCDDLIIRFKRYFSY